jgi:hypothetical protein
LAASRANDINGHDVIFQVVVKEASFAYPAMLVLFGFKPVPGKHARAPANPFLPCFFLFFLVLLYPSMIGWRSTEIRKFPDCTMRR